MQSPIIAGKGIRAINYLVDLICLSICYLIVNFLLEVFGAAINSGVLLLMIHFCYYFIFELLSYKTIGKIITQTHVTTLKNEKPDFLQILIRSLLRINPVDWLSYAFGTSVHGTHDSMSETMVVMDTGANKG